MPGSASPAPNPEFVPKSKRRFSLPLKLLLLTLLFIMVVEIMIFLPSIGREQEDFLNNRIAAGNLAVLALDASPSGEVSNELRSELLKHANAMLVGLKQPNGKNVQLMSDRFDPTNSTIARTIDLRDASSLRLMQQALSTLFMPSTTDMLRVLGKSPQQSDVRIEVVLYEKPLMGHLRSFAWRVLVLSLLISLFAGGLIYLSLLWLLVRPINQLTGSMERFAHSPETAVIDLPKRLSRDEIGDAQRQLNLMQGTVRSAFKERARLAALGTAVTKINHDLRNVLGTSLLLSDSLEFSEDPMVKKVAPKLVQEIERAADLCTSTLKFARNEEPELERSSFSTVKLMREIEDRLSRRDDFAATLKIHVSETSTMHADRAQIDRLFSNLILNASQAGATELKISAFQNKGDDALSQVLCVEDNGPGLPRVTVENLFKPFAATTKKDGTGLGLSITRDIARAHAGDIRLDKTDDQGTRFAVCFNQATLEI